MPTARNAPYRKRASPTAAGSEQSAAHIAARLGFSSATNFSKFFHRHTGKSPLAFRREIRGSQD
ncbi:helix-turn-helix domain-containing protein [Actinacidiphila glaucinigra]|uniref:helix-turn-helix domain-containing protein n=1 Tax=Actinacidiphila glaucinigra TaxID=235986 RepID=UPI003694617F